MLDASTDLSSSLWVLETLAQPEGAYDFYLEQPRGTFREIGPLAPGGGNIHSDHYFGASGDLARVLFSTLEGSRWPFDTTASGGTLYEYVGVEQSGETREREPQLVGVDGGRESTELISQCGTRLGSSSTEEEPNGLGSVYNAVSASGERVFFTAMHNDKCAGSQPPVDELFVREETPYTATTSAPEMRTVPISCPPAPLSPCADANFEGASSDGSKVFFTSSGKLLPGASEDNTIGDSAQECSATKGLGGCNLYEAELSSAGAQRLVLVSAGSADPEVQGVARVSEDGSHVYFVAKGKLTDVSNGLGSSALSGEDNLYVYADGDISFIATLAPSDAADWAHRDDRPVLASGEGRYLVFTSEADITDEGISSGKPQVFQYDAETGALARVSIGEEGYNDNGREPAVGSAISKRFPAAYPDDGTDSPTLAAGSQAPASGAVLFESPDALTPLALSDHRDVFGQLVPNVYEYRTGNVYLLSDGRDVSVVNGSPSVSLVGSDPSGDDVFFWTSDPLISADGNTQQDLYDARVEGGFPTPLEPADCREACQGALAGTPTLVAPGGSAVQAAEAGVPATSGPTPITPKAKKTVRRKAKPKKRRKSQTARKAIRRPIPPGHVRGSSGTRSAP